MTHEMLKNAPGALLIEFLTPILPLICVSVRCGDSVGGGRHSVCLGSVWRYGHKLLIKSHTPHRSLPKKGLRSRGLFEHLSSALFKSDIRSRSKVSHHNAEAQPQDQAVSAERGRQARPPHSGYSSAGAPGAVRPAECNARLVCSNQHLYERVHTD